MSANGTTTCGPSALVGLERTRFFPRQLLGPEELTQDQTYFIEKLRRHNRMLHGWGVVCGVGVMKDPDDSCKIIVDAGYALGPYGDEIVIEKTTVDVCAQDIDGNAVSSCGEPEDPWCSDIRVDRRAGDKVYLAVCYTECVTRPVRTLGRGCGCDSDCEYSRTRDGYAFRILTKLPSTYSDPMKPPDDDDILRCDDGKSCPDCPAEPWVILADITISASGGVDTIDCFAHRRYVVSFGDFYYLCKKEARADHYAYEIMARDTSNLIGSIAMADTTVLTATPPAATVALRNADDSWITMPVHFDVNPGETVREMLEREGNRRYYNPTTGDEVMLRELYTLAGVDPERHVDSLNDAIAPLNGMRANVRDLHVVSNAVNELLDPASVDELNTSRLGDPAAATDLPAASLAAARTDVHLAPAAMKMEIADVAKMSRDKFMEHALKRVPARDMADAERAAAAVHDAAVRLTRLGRAWRGGPTG